MRVAFTTLLFVFCMVTNGAAQSTGVPAHDKPDVVTSALAEALNCPVTVPDAPSPRGMFTSRHVRAVSQPPYRPGTPPNKDTRGILVFAGALAGMFAGGYIGYAVDTGWGTENAVKGIYIGGTAGAVLGGLAVWKLTR